MHTWKGYRRGLKLVESYIMDLFNALYATVEGAE